MVHQEPLRIFKLRLSQPILFPSEKLFILTFQIEIKESWDNFNFKISFTEKILS